MISCWWLNNIRKKVVICSKVFWLAVISKINCVRSWFGMHLEFQVLCYFAIISLPSLWYIHLKSLWCYERISTYTHTHARTVHAFDTLHQGVLSIVIVKNAYLANELHSSLLSNSIEKCCRYESFESEKSTPAHTCQNRTSKFSEDTLIHIVGCDKISQSCYFICFFCVVCVLGITYTFLRSMILQPYELFSVDMEHVCGMPSKSFCIWMNPHLRLYFQFQRFTNGKCFARSTHRGCIMRFKMFGPHSAYI